MSIWTKLFGTEQKAVERGIASSDTQPRGSIDKAYYPGFLVKPPFGWPKYKNVYELRRLSSTPQAAMAIQTIVDEVTAVPWDIVPKEDFTLEGQTKVHVDEITQFFNNPNSNKESFEKILKVVVRELLTLDSGIIVKEFNKLQKLTEIKATDSAGFLKNPNQFGKIDGREDFMLEGFVDYSGELSASAFTNANLLNSENESRPGGISVQDAQTKAAYFQYGYLTSARPVPFGKKEIIWMEKNPLSYDIYGLSPIETILDVLQTLIYSIQYNLEYFEDNNVPKGFIQLAGGSEEDLKAFGERWNDLQYKKDKLSGRLRKLFHRVPITNSMNAQFVKVQFSAQELELISSQTWFTKLVWGAFGVTPSEVGFTEDSNRATEIAQSRVFKRKAIYPMLRLIEYHINKELISEWEYDDVEFKFTTFDVEEEKAKYDLYKVQIDTKLLTINEIRLKEGLDEVEWGDNPENDQFGTGEEFNFDEDFDEDFDSENIEDSKKKLKEDESKALTTSDPTTLGENELIATFNRTIKDIEKEVIKLLTQEAKKDRLTQIKSVEGVADSLDKINLDKTVENAVKQTIKNFYEKGWELSEKQLKMNLQMNMAQVNFIQKYTYDNIKGMNDDLKNKLRQEIRRSIIAGEGIGKLAPRVKDVFEISRQRAKAIARTELNRAEGMGQLQAMKSSGRKMTKTWDAHLDSKTSAICKALDGQTVNLNEKFKYKGEEFDANPAHVNCRSRVKYDVVIEKEAKDFKKKELKYKYIRRTGSPGDYTYYYRDGSSSKKPKKQLETDSQYADRKYQEIKLKDRKIIDEKWSEYKETGGTINKYYSEDTGKWTKERQDIHKDIAKEYISLSKKAMPKDNKKPKVIFMAGLPGAGKTYNTQKFYKTVSGTDGKIIQDSNGNNYLVLCADDIKAHLPEYDGGFGAQIVHEESSAVNSILTKKFIEKGVNIIIDGTLKTTKNTDKKIKMFKDNGYDTNITFVNSSVKRSITNAHNRYLKVGRVMPYHLIVSYHPKIVESISENKNKADSYIEIVNEEGKPQKIIKRGKF